MEKFDKVEHILKGFLAMHNICVSSKMWNIGRLKKIKIITENFNMTVLGQFANAMKVNSICQFEKLPHTKKLHGGLPLEYFQQSPECQTGAVADQCLKTLQECNWAKAEKHLFNF